MNRFAKIIRVNYIVHPIISMFIYESSACGTMKRRKMC